MAIARASVVALVAAVVLQVSYLASAVAAATSEDDSTAVSPTLGRHLRRSNQRILQQTQPCILTRKEKRYRVAGANVFRRGNIFAQDFEESSWSCLLCGEDAAIHGPKFLDVDLDDAYLESMGAVSGKTLMDCPSGAAINGSRLEISSRATVSFTSIPESTAEDRPENGMRPRKTRRLKSEGTRSVLVIRVKSSADGSETTPSVARLKDDVFNDDVCLAKQYKACSHNKLKFVPAQGNGVDGGILTVTIDSAVKGQDEANVRSAATSAASAHFGIFNLQNEFDHVMVCIPPGTKDNWVAYGYIDSWLTVYNDEWCSMVSAQMHELGHNLNLAHSGVENKGQYEDKSGMMGISYDQDDGPRMCFNPVKNWQLGWFEGHTKELDPTSEAPFGARMVGVDVQNPGSDQLVVIRIRDNNKDYYIGYNGKKGRNSETVQGGNMVWVGFKEAGYIPSRRLALLSESDTYTIGNFRGQSNSKLKIRFAERLSDEEVYVDIYFESDGKPEIPVLQNPCTGDGKAYFQLDLITDDFGGETSWSLSEKDSGKTIMSGSDYTSNAAYPENTCISRGVDYTFEIKDTHHDGICCGNGQGSYKVTVDGEEVASGGDFDTTEASTFTVSNDNPDPIPTPNPTRAPSKAPTKQPTPNPTPQPTKAPIQAPITVPPTPQPSKAPVPQPTKSPTASPTPQPVPQPTKAPTVQPTASPTPAPVTPDPSSSPTSSPSGFPTQKPSSTPSENPSASFYPSSAPSAVPSLSQAPSAAPSSEPSSEPSMSQEPSATPSSSPSSAPTLSSSPSSTPSSSPSAAPTLSQAPSLAPSSSPSLSISPSSEPSIVPSLSTFPSSTPSSEPSSSGRPSATPSSSPSAAPTLSSMPSDTPSSGPSQSPTLSLMPSDQPSSSPTAPPTRPLPQQPNNSSLPEGLPEEQASCSEGEAQYKIDLGIDAYGNETTFEIRDRDSSELVAFGSDFAADTIYSRTGCIPASADYTFKLTDEWGDGLCCNYGAGFYFFYVNGDLVTKGGIFGTETVTQFEVP